MPIFSAMLEDFGVRGGIIHVARPVVTLYEFEPAPGVKSLPRRDQSPRDIARSMSTISARRRWFPAAT